VPLTPAHLASGTVRTRLAAVALEAAAGVDGVVGGDAGPNRLHVTESGPGGSGGPLAGVRAVAEPGGGYAVDLGLRAGLVPLEALAHRVRLAVHGAAGAAGLGTELGPISVTFHDVVDPDQELAEAFAAALDTTGGAPAP